MPVRVALLLWTGVLFAGGAASARAQPGDELPQKRVVIETRVVAMPEYCHADLGDEGGTWCRVEWTRKHGIESASLDDLNLFRLLEAVQGNRRGHIMQLPRLEALDGQEAAIVAGAVQARFLPRISGDGRCVTLRAEIGCKDWPIAEPTSPCTGFSLAVHAKVPDQRTIAVTAKTVTNDVLEEFSPHPFLARIPCVNRLVRTVGYSRETVKIIVLLTPRVVHDGEVAEVEPLRGGIRGDENRRFPRP